MIAVQDNEATAFEKTEERLYEWGRACQNNARVLGLPRVSGIAGMIANVQMEAERKRKKFDKVLLKARKAWKQGDPPIDAKLVAEALGFVEPFVSAKGKQKQTFQEPKLSIDSRDMETDFIIGNLSGWAKKCLFRSYMYVQPDRTAAEEMRMRVGEYARRRRAAVEQVAIRLEQRYIAGSRNQVTPSCGGKRSTATP